MGALSRDTIKEHEQHETKITRHNGTYYLYCVDCGRLLERLDITL